MKKGTGLIIKNCEVCNALFESHLWMKRKFCSSKCAYIGRTMHKKQTEYKCVTCGKSVLRSPCQVLTNVFCSKRCSQLFQTNKPGHKKPANELKQTLLTCKLCGKTFYRFNCSIVPGKDVFCSHSCSTKYTNQYKRGSKSKLEKWLEQKLFCFDIPFYMNDRKILNGYELDIYFPTKNIAFEIDGIWHRLPINGKEHFEKIQHNDEYKNQRCKELGITLIRIQNEKVFSENEGNKVLSEIIQAIGSPTTPLITSQIEPR